MEGPPARSRAGQGTIRGRGGRDEQSPKACSKHAVREGGLTAAAKLHAWGLTQATTYHLQVVADGVVAHTMELLPTLVGRPAGPPGAFLPGPVQTSS